MSAERLFGEDLDTSPCDICEQEWEVHNLLPHTARTPEREFVNFACDGCTDQLGFMCSEHGLHGLAFEDGTSACVHCINRDVEENWQGINALFQESLDVSPKRREIGADLREWLDMVGGVIEESGHKTTARAIVTLAQRTHITAEEVIRRTCVEGARVLLPWLDRRSSSE